MTLPSSSIEQSDLRSIILPAASRTGFQPTCAKHRHANIYRVATIEHSSSSRYVYRVSHWLRIDYVVGRSAYTRRCSQANKNRLYVHEVFVSDKIKKGDTLQTAASKPHGGIALYRDILANVLESERKVTDSASGKQEKAAESSVQTSDNQGGQTVQSAVEAASAEVNTEPTPAQAEAGNYKKGHVTIGEFDITIENPAGSVRKSVDAAGKEWTTTMANAYGYIKGTEGADGRNRSWRSE